MGVPAAMHDREVQAAFAAPLARLAAGLELHRALAPAGMVAAVGDGVARVTGLRDIGAEALLRFEGGALGMAHDLAEGHTGVVLLSAPDTVSAGQSARALGHLPEIPSGVELLGRIVDPLGRPLDGGPAMIAAPRPVFQDAPALTRRGSVDRPLATGITVIDAAIPIGRGQRQLIVGDRNVGKTALALDIVAAQRPDDVACVYVIIGQPLSRVLAIRDLLSQAGALRNTVVVAADSGSPPGLQYLAPYAGATIAETIRDLGCDALIVYDDLTKHADAYRELSLLIGHPPGREAFPGDIFHVHAELLERAAALSKAAGGRSVTALPIVETTDSDISAYIPTNLISITDGQIYLDAARFERDVRPAVDIGRSVSRIGGVAQSPAMRAAARRLRLEMARFEGLEALTRVGLDVDPATRRAVERGRIMRELLRQPRFSPRSLLDQITTLMAVSEGWLDGLAPDRATSVIVAASARLRATAAPLVEALDTGAEIPAAWREAARAAVAAAREGVS